MNICDLLSPAPAAQMRVRRFDTSAAIHDDDLMSVWEQLLFQSGFRLKAMQERNTLTDAVLSPLDAPPTRDLQRVLGAGTMSYVRDTPMHIKVIGRHMNGSFRCHIGTGKASRPIQSQELQDQMQLLAVFFRCNNSKSQMVSPDFIFFPTWLFHLFRYTQHGATPGRTDVRFLEDASMAKEDHIYRLNHVLNTLFRFNLHRFRLRQLWETVALANFLFMRIGLDRTTPVDTLPMQLLPAAYSALLNTMTSPRPAKSRSNCINCNTKPASRRKLCVACYRYQLKHKAPRPLRLIVANRHGLRANSHMDPESAANSSTTELADATDHMGDHIQRPKQAKKAPVCGKSCANCGVHETHQWYRNLCGQGHWCETCKSYYLRHSKVRPAELFLKAAKRKVDVRSLFWHGNDDDDNINNEIDDNHTERGGDNYQTNDNDQDAWIITTSGAKIANWVPSGCRPHLYHPRHRGTVLSSAASHDSQDTTSHSHQIYHQTHHQSLENRQQHGHYVLPPVVLTDTHQCTSPASIDSPITPPIQSSPAASTKALVSPNSFHPQESFYDLWINCE